MSNGTQQDAFSLFAQGSFADGLSRLSEDEDWNFGGEALPIFLGIPKANGYGESLLLASVVRQTRLHLGRQTDIIAPPKAASILRSDKNFNLICEADEACVAARKARLPLAELRKFLKSNRRDQKQGKIARSDSLVRIGIAWRSASNKSSGKVVSFEKSVPAEEFIEFLKPEIDGRSIELVSFQRHITDDETKALGRSGLKFSLVEQCFHDELDQSRLAAKIREIDLMISISTTTAHIAGYLKVPTVVLAKNRAHKQWFWPAQKKSGKRFYSSLDVVVASRDADPKQWWRECIGDARRCIRDYLN